MATLKLDNGAAHILVQGLTLPGWATEPTTLHVAGKCVKKVEVAIVGAMPDANEKNGESFNKWVVTPTKEVEVTDQERDICRSCVEHQIRAGNLRPSPHLNLVLETLGIIQGE